MGKHTYLKTFENYAKHYAGDKRSEFIEKNPDASNQDADVLFCRILKLCESNESFRNKLNTEYLKEKRKVQERYEESMAHARSLGDATENNYKRAETLGPEGLSSASKKGNETLGVEGRKDRTAKANKTLGPEGRSARSAAGKETLGPEGRSEVSRKRAKTLGEEGLSESAKKTVKTCKEKYGDDHYSKQSKRSMVPVRIASVEKRVEEDYTKVLSSLPRYFESNDLRKSLLKYFKNDARHGTILNSTFVNKQVKSLRIQHVAFNIHENLSNYCAENTIKSVLDRITEENKNLIPATKRIFLEELNMWMQTLQDTGITQDMMNEFKRADRLRPYFDMETEVLGRTGKPIWKKCTWKKKQNKCL